MLLLSLRARRRYAMQIIYCILESVSVRKRRRRCIVVVAMAHEVYSSSDCLPSFRDDVGSTIESLSPCSV